MKTTIVFDLDYYLKLKSALKMIAELNALNRKYKSALVGFSKLSNIAKQKDKHVFIFPLRSAGLTHKQAINLGFKVSFRLWRSCLDQRSRNKGRLI